MTDQDVSATFRYAGGFEPFTRSSEVAGGFMTVANAAARTALPSTKRVAYMVVREEDTGDIYEMNPDLTTWDPANFGGSVADATTSTKGIIQLAGDLDGTAAAPSVVKIHDATVPVAGSLTTGNVLKVSGSSTLSYGAVNLAGGSNHVTGALPLANVTPGTDGQVLKTNSTPVPTWVTVGGDASGAPDALSVVKVRGATVPAAGSLTTGNVLQVSGASALSYGAVNLAGGSNYVTGTLPVTNLPDADASNKGIVQLAGDLGGTGSAAAAPLVGSLTGVSGTLALASGLVTVQWNKDTSAPVITQATRTTDAAAQPLRIRPQAPWASASTNKDAGHLEFEIPAPVSGGAQGRFKFLWNNDEKVKITWDGTNAVTVDTTATSGVSSMTFGGSNTGVSRFKGGTQGIIDGGGTQLIALSSGSYWFTHNSVQCGNGSAGASFDMFATALGSDLAPGNIRLRGSSPHSSATSTNRDTGLVDFQPGSPQTGGRYRMLICRKTSASGHTIFEVGQAQADSVSASDCVAICLGDPITSTHAPTGSGQRVVFLGSAATVPTVKPGAGVVTIYTDGTTDEAYRHTHNDLVQSIAPSLASVVFASDANKTATASHYRATIMLVTSSATLTATRNLVVPIVAGFTWIVTNSTTGGQSIQVIGASGTGVTIATGKTAIVYADGTNIVRATADV